VHDDNVLTGLLPRPRRGGEETRVRGEAMASSGSDQQPPNSGNSLPPILLPFFFRFNFFLVFCNCIELVEKYYLASILLSSPDA
jgi:hypothetical protein